MLDEESILFRVAQAQRVYVQKRVEADAHALALRNQILDPYKTARDESVRVADSLGVARVRIGRVGLGTKATRELYKILEAKK